MKNIMTGTYLHNDELHSFNFATNLSAYSKLIFVNSVADTLVDENRYDSIVRDLIFDFNIIRVFTDIDTSFVNIIDDEGNVINPIIPIECFLEETNIVEIIKENMNIGLLDELNDAVNKTIEYRTGIRFNPLNDAIASLVNTIERKISEIDLDSVMEMANIFSGLTGDITPESIVNAYLSSDTHKKNMTEIEESKKQKSEFAENMNDAIKSVNNQNKSKTKK
jgi:hypothetical protein